MKALKEFWTSPLVMVVFAVWTGWYIWTLVDDEDSTLIAWLVAAFFACAIFL